MVDLAELLVFMTDRLKTVRIFMLEMCAAYIHITSAYHTVTR